MIFLKILTTSNLTMPRTLFSNIKLQRPALHSVIGKAKTLFNYAKHLSKVAQAVEPLLRGTKFDYSQYENTLKNVEKYATGAETIATELENVVASRTSGKFGIQQREARMFKDIPVEKYEPPKDYVPRSSGEEYALKRRKELMARLGN